MMNTNERNDRLWLLTRKRVTGEMTDEEEKEYRRLQGEQSARLSQDITTITRRNRGNRYLVTFLVFGIIILVSIVVGFLVYWASPR